MKTSMYTGFTQMVNQYGAAKAVQYARQLGFDAVEGYYEQVEPLEKAKQLRTLLEDAGMRASCVSVYIDLLHPDTVRTMDTLKRMADLTQALGAPYLHHTLVPSCQTRVIGTPSFDAVFDDVVERAGLIADYTKPLGLCCLYEDQGFYFNGYARFERFLAALDRENTGVCADFGNSLFVDEPPEVFIGALSHKIKNVHVKDYLHKPGTAANPGQGWLRSRSGAYLRDTIAGHGCVDMVSCLTLLQAAGYDGYYAFEIGGPEPFEQGLKESFDNLMFYERLAAYSITKSF